MAILNWIQQGTYSVARIVQYDQHSRVIGIDLETFSDSSKAESLQVTSFLLVGETHKVLLSKDWAAPPAGSYNLYDSFFVNGTGQGAWEGFNNVVVSWIASQWQVGVQPYDNQIVLMADENIYYSFDDETKTWTIANQDLLTSARWDEAFGVSTQNVAGNNILKLAYDYLHTLPQFVGASPG